MLTRKLTVKCSRPSLNSALWFYQHRSMLRKMTSIVVVPQANKKGNNLPSMLTRTHKIDHCQVWLTAGDSTSISEISSPSLIKRCTQFNELFHPRIHATEKQRWKQFAPNRFENSHAQLSSSFKPFCSRIWNPRESASEKYSLSLLKTTLVIRWGCPSNHITRGFILNTKVKIFHPHCWQELLKL